MTIKIRSAKNKGMRLQRWVCEQISILLDIPFDNQDDDCPIHSRECGQSGTDVVLRAEARKRFNFDVECKCTENFHIYADIEQAKSNTNEGRNWLLFHKKNHSEPIVVMDAKSFFELLKKINKEVYIDNIQT